VTQENYADRVLHYVCAAIAHPHTTITEHDKHRALEIIRFLYPGEHTIEHLYSQMNQDDFKQVKNIREHARNAIK
jgi:hypothetical protein